MTNPSSPERIAVQFVCHTREVATRTSACSETTRMRAARYAAPRSFAASRRVLTSAVGFFGPASSSSLLRLTQMTGTFSFRHGSTSW